MRKKFLSLALALVMCLGLAVPALAAETAQETDFKQKTLDMLKNDFIFEGGIVKVDWTRHEGREIVNGAVTMNKTVSWEPKVYIPLGTKISLAPLAIEDRFKMVVFKDFDNPAIAEETASYQFDTEGSFHIGTYTKIEDYGIPLICDIEVVVVNEHAAKLKTPFLDIGYFDECYKKKDTYGKPYFESISPMLREDIEWAYERGISRGTSATTFSPFDSVRRSQMIQMLWNYSGKPEPRSTVLPFEDVKATDGYYKALCWANEIGLVQEIFPVGMAILEESPDGKFCPNWICTNAQVIKALSCFFHQQMPDAIQNGQVRTFGSYCQRVNFCHYLHYAYQLVSGTLAN